MATPLRQAATSLLLLLTFAALGVEAPAQQNVALPKLHQAAPPLKLQKVLGNTAGTRTELINLRGKTVVLEFWATWCAPCVGEIPAINALVKSLDPQKVQFISITDEDPASVKAFLRQRPISGWVGFDTTGKVFERYGVVTRPATIVIDPHGKIISNSVAPDQLTRTQLLAVNKGSVPSVPAINLGGATGRATVEQEKALDDQYAAAGADSNSSELFAIRISAGKGEQAHLYIQDASSYDILAAPLKVLIQYALGYSETLISMDQSQFPKETFNLSVKAPGTPPDRLRAMVETALEVSTKSKIEHHVFEEDVEILGFDSKKRTQVDSIKSGGGIAAYDSTKRLFISISATPKQLAAAATDAMGLPVIDETNSTLACSATVVLPKEDIKTLATVLGDQCGLTLVKNKRLVDRITVTPAERDVRSR